MRLIRTLYAGVAISLLAGCGRNGVQPAPFAGLSTSANALRVTPDLRLRPPKLHFSASDSKSKTEEVVGYEPNGSYHTTCVTLGIATISYEQIKKHNAYFLVTPEHEGKCVVGFNHTKGSKVETKNLLIIVN